MINQTTYQVPEAGIWDYVAEVRPKIESALLLYQPTPFVSAQSRFDEAMHYALFPGGKRLRPVLTMLGAEVVGGSGEDVLPAGSAVEYLHNSSIIFDDLPCMDNAAERRGKSALHVHYGEGLAILVAIALLNTSYKLIIDCGESNKEWAFRAHTEMVNCIEGQVGGQAIDIAKSAYPAVLGDRSKFEAMRNLKATALIRLALRLGAILSGASEQQLGVLSAFADLLGDAYQISDDIADTIEDESLLGSQRHTTFPQAYGKESAKYRVSLLAAEAKKIIKTGFGEVRPAALLCDIADYVAERSS
jgi:geranylgeranyl diphosphate synthase type II